MSEESFNRLEDQLSQVIGAIGAMREDMVAMQQNIVVMQQNYVGMRQDVTAMQQNYVGMRQDITAMQQNYDAVREDIHAIRVRIDAEGVLSDRIERDFGDYRQRIDDIDDDLADVETLSDKLDRRQRRMNARLNRVEGRRSRGEN